jgi:hypothetical protein
MKEVYFTAWLFSKPQVLRWPVARANLSHFSISVFSISAFLFSFSPYFPHFRLATRRQSRYLLRCPRVRRNPHFLLQIACNMGQNHRHVKGCLTHGMILPLCCTLEET